MTNHGWTVGLECFHCFSLASISLKRNGLKFMSSFPRGQCWRVHFHELLLNAVNYVYTWVWSQDRAKLSALSTVSISCTNPIGLDTALGLVTFNYLKFSSFFKAHRIADVRKEANHEPEDEVQLSLSLLLLCNLCASSTVPNATSETVQITHFKIGFDKIQQFLTGSMPNREAHAENESIKKPLAINYRDS